MKIYLNSDIEIQTNVSPIKDYITTTNKKQIILDLFNNLSKFNKNIFLNTNDSFIELFSINSSKKSEFSIEFDPDEIKYILWPNREGELIKSHLLNKRKFLKFYESKNHKKEVKIVYPSTASSKLIIIKLKNYKLLIIYSMPESLARVCEIKLDYSLLKKSKYYILKISGYINNFKFFIYNKNDLFDKSFKSLNYEAISFLINNIQIFIKNSKNNIYKTNFSNIFNRKKINYSNKNIKLFVQTGLIGPDGKSFIPDNKGFLILDDISKIIYNYAGKGNILHIFGYAKGHDILYPDYTPSIHLGGKKLLAKAIEKIHKNSQFVSIYLNSRIADKEIVKNSKKLLESVKKINNKSIIEIYNNREFFVMDPESEYWQETIIKWGIFFKNLGADYIQLDQIGGREAISNAGETWGKGYINIIKYFKSIKLKTWIQGSSDLYPADLFELTFRKPLILKNGIIRGGTPMGESCPLSIILSTKIINKNSGFIIPFSKYLRFKQFPLNNTYIDVESKKGELFIYNNNYNNILKKNISNIINKLENS